MHDSQFFQQLHGDETVNFRCLGKKLNKSVNGFFNQHTSTVLQQFNEQNCEIYFVVNGGGYKDEQIANINAVFIDFDCGRDEVTKEYYPQEIVAAYKAQKLEVIKAFSLQPSYIVETRNGYHVYWLVHKGATVQQFTECQLRLIRFFDSDPAVKNPARLMRVPGFNWCKDANNKFKCTIVESNDVRYNIKDVLNTLPEVESVDRCFRTNSNHKCIDTLVVIDGTETPDRINDNIELIKAKNVQALQTRLDTQPVTLSSNEIWDYLKKQPLQDFLGISGTSFRCIFHEDNNPSAGIVVNDKTGHHIYICSSGSCGFKGTIIDVARKLTGLDEPETLRLLRKVYRIEFAATEWEISQKEIIDKNQELINSPDFPTMYPEVYKLIKNYLPLLNTLHQIAKQNVSTKTFTDLSGRPVFFSSIRELARIMKKDAKNLTIHLAILTYLGLINKLPGEEIPEPLRKRAREEAKKYNRKYRIGFYSIPSFDSNALAFSNAKAKEFKERGFSVRGFSREMLLSALGTGEADRVFPQMTGQPIPKLNQEITAQMEDVAMKLITQKGWTTQEEILQQINLRFKGQQRFKETQLKRMLPDFYPKYLLKPVRLNKELKELFGIECKGYPIIIIDEQAA